MSPSFKGAPTSGTAPTSVRLPLMAAGDAPSDPAPTITPALIRQVIDDFYDSARQDAGLAPIFSAHVTNWDAHLLRIQAFWEAVLLGRGGYSGRPLEAHLEIPGLDRRHFSTWLRLFRESAARHAAPDQVDAFMSHAGRMASRMMAAGNVA